MKRNSPERLKTIVLVVVVLVKAHQSAVGRLNNLHHGY